MRYVVLDTETTGLDPKQGHRIIEIGCVEMMGRQVTDRHFHTYLNPQRAVDEGARAVHGLSDEFLSDKPKIAEVMPEFLEFVAGAEIIIHNAPFDVGFLNAELGLQGKPAFSEFVAKVTDSLTMAREMFPGKRNSLDALCDRLGVNNSHRTLHGALLDAQILAEVFLAMTRGQDSLMIDAGSSPDEYREARVQLSTLSLPVYKADQAELALHSEYLKTLDKESKGACVWRQYEVAPILNT
jgi:DNA polymerase-3 subunit epsilon